MTAAYLHAHVLLRCALAHGPLVPSSTSESKPVAVKAAGMSGIRHIVSNMSQLENRIATGLTSIRVDLALEKKKLVSCLYNVFRLH